MFPPFFSEFFHRKSPAAISAGIIMAHAKRTSTGMMADNLHVASRCPFGGSSGAEKSREAKNTELVLELFYE